MLRGAELSLQVAYVSGPPYCEHTQCSLAALQLWCSGIDWIQDDPIAPDLASFLPEFRDHVVPVRTPPSTAITFLIGVDLCDLLVLSGNVICSEEYPDRIW
jgi:hypothetical protein